MRNTTNWYLYTSCKSKKKISIEPKPEFESKEIITKLNLIKKTIR